MEFASEVGRLAELAASSLCAGPEGLQSLGLAIRTAMAQIGASLLEQLLAADTGYVGPRVDCGAGHQAEFVSNRAKGLRTVLGPVRTERAYYHCEDCHAGVVPRDEQLGVAGSSLSPGLRAMADRVGATVPFAKGALLLAELAGVELGTKAIERAAEADGQALSDIASGGGRRRRRLARPARAGRGAEEATCCRLSSSLSSGVPRGN